MLTVLNFLLECDSVYITYDTFYHYVIHSQSMANIANPNYLESVNKVYKTLIAMYDHPAFSDKMRLQAELYMTELLVKGINTRMGFKNQNLMRTDPYWVDKIPAGAKVALCGAGEFGRIYRRTLDTRTDISYAGCVDENPGQYKYDETLGDLFPIEAVESMDFDYVIITIKNQEKAENVKSVLKKYVPEDKLLWFKQEEIYWRFAEANGLLK
jgi:hypothetical protein